RVLIPDELFKDFIDEKNFDRESIMWFADGLGIDAGIVVGRLQKEGYLKFG
ncbi:MAG: XRE family transcriptional regulator, partial [Clostridiaceae bacterium]|nr:XRE family transcriptional regulator [Clostridiaceae bacterium]